MRWDNGIRAILNGWQERYGDVLKVDNFHHYLVGWTSICHLFSMFTGNPCFFCWKWWSTTLRWLFYAHIYRAGITNELTGHTWKTGGAGGGYWSGCTPEWVLPLPTVHLGTHWNLPVMIRNHPTWGLILDQWRRDSLNRLKGKHNLFGIPVDWFCFQCLHTDPSNLLCRNMRHQSSWSMELKYQRLVGLGASHYVVTARSLESRQIKTQRCGAWGSQN